MAQISQYRALFWVLTALTFLIILLQLAIFLPATIAVHHSTLQLGRTVVTEIVWCGFLDMILWVALAVMIVAAVWICSQRSSWVNERVYSIGVFSWILSVIFIFCANQYWFPVSLFSEFTSSLLPTVLVKIVLISSFVFLLSGLLFTVVIAGMQYKLARFLLALGLLLLVAKQFPTTSSAYSGKSPNIIIIGLDSVRPDVLSLYGSSLKTPNLDRWLQSAARFPQAYSPLARTYPAWVSILTGLYPLHNGVRHNLNTNGQEIQLHTIATQLQTQGYATLFATDDRRFSQLDHSFGFQEIVAPKIGVNDFLLGSFNDFPLSNLVINTQLGKWFYPYNYANRGSFITYQPQTFTAEVQRLLQTPRTKPVFLALHLCLLHWPHATFSAAHNHVPMKVQELQEAYRRGVPEVDQQFGKMWEALENSGMLKNAVVFLISDHGEALGIPGERLLDLQKYQGKFSAAAHQPLQELVENSDGLGLSQSISHGTDIMSPSQFQVLFAARTFGNQPLKAQSLEMPVSLIDIMPTILDYTSVGGMRLDGISLKPYMEAEQQVKAPQRLFFTETGFTPKKLNSNLKNTNFLMSIAERYYQVNPQTGHLEIQQNAHKMIIRDKQRAVIAGEWLLADLPSEQGPYRVLINRRTRQWTDDFATEFARNSPSTMMSKQLVTFYAEELK